jgi:hypothetical protein
LFCHEGTKGDIVAYIGCGSNFSSSRRLASAGFPALAVFQG